MAQSKAQIQAFIDANDSWVIEGCYTDLLESVANNATEIIFMNLSVEACIENAKSRPWEPHKYKTKQAQDQNLEMLTQWISQYTQRDDVCSFAAHQQFYDSYAGRKRMITQNEVHT